MENPNETKTPETRRPGARASFRDFKGVFFLIVACLLVMGFIWYFSEVLDVINHYLGYLSAVIYGVFIAFLLNPVFVFFEPKLKNRYKKSKHEKVRRKAEVKAKRWSIAIATVIGVLVIAVLIMLIIPQVLNSVVTLGEEAPRLITKVSQKLEKLNADRSWAGAFQKYIDAALDSLEIWITETLVPKATTAVISLTSAAFSVLMFVANFFIGMVIAVYVLKEKNNFIAWGKKLSFAFFKPETANLIIDTARHGNKIFGGFLLGALINSAIVGVICFLFNVIAGIPYPLLVATIMGITNIIPFFGPFLGAIPSAFIIVLIDPIKALIFLAFVLILNQIEGNIITPRILGNITGISEFWVTFALLFFGAMFGVFGMIMGVPILAVISYVFTKLVDKHMVKKELSAETMFYLEVDRYNSDENNFAMIDRKKLEEEKNKKKRFHPKSERLLRWYASFKGRFTKK